MVRSKLTVGQHHEIDLGPNLRWEGSTGHPTPWNLSLGSQAARWLSETIHLSSGRQL
jgi:hypothetical protein